MTKDKLKGIGGWLVFFIITIMIISPIYSLIILFSEPLVSYFDYIEGLAVISTLILVGIFLIKKKYYAVTFAKVVLFSMFLTAIIYLLLGDYTLIQSIIYSIIWFSYLSSSKRVKNTYSKIKEPKEGTFIWPNLAIIFSFLAPLSGFLFSIVALRKISKNRKLKGLGISITALIISILIFVYFVFVVAFYYGDLNGSILDSDVLAENAKEALEAEGYEVQVLFLLYDTEPTESLLVMKSLGSREEQLWSGMLTLSLVYPDVSKHSVDILEETQRCSYSVSGNLFRVYHAILDGEEIMVEGRKVYSSEVRQLMLDELSESESCY